jgi:hypothetical protein
MGDKRPWRGRTITKTQAIGILAMTLALFFVISFGAKSLELYRLHAWHAQLEQEIAAMQREIESLKLEKQRRESLAWVDQALRETGRVPSNVIVVTVIDVAPVAVAAPVVTPVLIQDALPHIPTETLFRNPNWEAWQKLIRQRD